jgi:hypothetical protein
LPQYSHSLLGSTRDLWTVDVSFAKKVFRNCALRYEFHLFVLVAAVCTHFLALNFSTENIAVSSHSLKYYARKSNIVISLTLLFLHLGFVAVKTQIS